MNRRRTHRVRGKGWLCASSFGPEQADIFRRDLLPDCFLANTLFNANAQSGAEYVPEMKRLGIRHFRVELLRENAAETAQLLERYTRVLMGLENPAETLRSLRVLNQLGVTRGTLVHE